ncbi:hypothetical protein DICPUDRAFT_99405 [Dictyostelium purpureum]|uniref:G-protein coupled receptors family 2 profile 2 domain-containing protein n=1 Tax=Dictyostelium purpureum TaxID=5786 RepID=F0ZYY6_DICPU|nr:uncharacterized protein DICPUDRAFT_99405 [Dictyostelium purpureum]EGC30844.1 hypothetical protein DICPUDRAFT_99405 [Dictyostelium purpureum]|eukprot:XP_003292633.1 hypothetical protein DICPUDRAFT_99405 [Dictyostelium purpureum]
MIIFIKYIFILLIILLNKANLISSLELPPGFCPQPLLYRNTTNREKDIESGFEFVGDTNCVLPCPSPLFTTKQWDSFFLMSLVLGSISMFASLFLIITYSPLVNRNHTRHTIGILSMFIGIFFIMVSDGRQLWDIELGNEKYCPEPGRYARQSDTKCLTTGLFFQFGCVSAILWWSTLAFDLWITIAKKRITTRKQIIYYIVALNAVAIVLTFGPIVKKQYGFGQAAIGCWMLDLKYQYGFFWVPLGICLSIGSVFIGLILYEIYKISDIVKKKYLRKHIKPLCLIVLMCIEFFYMFIYYSYVTANQSKYNKSMTEYIECLMINAANQPGTYKCDLKTISPSAQFTFLFALRLMGLEGMIFYGFTRQTKKIWKKSYWFNNSYVKRLFPTHIIPGEKSIKSNGSGITKSIEYQDEQTMESIELSGIESNNISPQLNQNQINNNNYDNQNNNV